MATAAQIKNFIEELGKLACAEAKRRINAGKGFVLPSVCIAQSAIETGWGTAGIMVKANAYFGIKAGGSWTGAVYRADTWEVANGEAYNTTANFRAYSSLAESVADYYDLIGNSSRYSAALSFGNSNWKTPRECITAIWSGGYATDTLYVEKIMNTITARNLTKYDSMIPNVDVTEGATPSVNHFWRSWHLTQGTLVIIDSGRAVENSRDILNSVTIEWDSAPTATANTRYIINGVPENCTFFLIELIGDVATTSHGFNNEDIIYVSKGAKFGFYIITNDGSPLTPERLPSGYSFSLTNADFIADDERYNRGIAYFMKIEI